MTGKHCSILFAALLLAGCASGPAPVSDNGTGPLVTPAPRKQPARSDRRERVVETVQAMLGVPYRYGGTTRAGFDCSGLVWYSHRRAGLRVPRTSVEQYRAVKKVSRHAMKAGDVLFFKTGWTRGYHVATYIGAGLFVHAPSSGRRVRTDSLDKPYWRKRLVRVGNFY